MTKLPQILIINEPNDNNKHCLNGKTRKENFPGWDLNLDSLDRRQTRYYTVATEDYAKVRFYEAYCLLYANSTIKI